MVPNAHIYLFTDTSLDLWRWNQWFKGHKSLLGVLMELSKDAALLYPSLIKIYITWELQGNYLGLSRIKKLASFPISSDPCMSERPKAAAALSVAATRTSGMDMRSVTQARFITSGYENSLVKTKQNPKWFASTHVRTISFFLSFYL